MPCLLREPRRETGHLPVGAKTSDYSSGPYTDTEQLLNPGDVAWLAIVFGMCRRGMFPQTSLTVYDKAQQALMRSLEVLN